MIKVQRPLVVLLGLISYYVSGEEETDYMHIWQEPPYVPKEFVSEAGIKSVEDVASFEPYEPCDYYESELGHLEIKIDTDQEGKKYWMSIKISAHPEYQLDFAELIWPSYKKPKHTMILPFVNDDLIEIETWGKRKQRQAELKIDYYEKSKHPYADSHHCSILNLRELVKSHNK